MSEAGSVKDTFPKKVLIELDVLCREYGGGNVEVTLTHPMLKGGFVTGVLRDSVVKLLLENVRVDKTKGAVEEFMENTSKLIELSSQLKQELLHLRGKS